MTSQLCHLLDWDSEFFGLRIARLNSFQLDPDSVTNALAWCQANSVECLYFLADSFHAPTVHLAEDHGFRLVDARLTLSRSLANCRVNDFPGPRLRIAVEDDLPHLRQLARLSHTDSRFFFDSRFSPSKAGALYATWIEKSCHGWADLVLVSGSPGEPSGYCTGHLKRDGSGSIGLIAIEASVQGQGLGGELVASALSFFARSGATHAQVVTQARNIAAQRLYQRAGFLTHSLQFWYHRWFPSRIQSSQFS